MKTKAYKLLLCGTLLVAACKKDPQIIKEDTADAANDNMRVTAIDSNYLPLTVVTIAGKANTEGYADGSGKQARFNGPWGIDLMDDGTLYVAEVFNHTIRKITPSGVVSTVNIPSHRDGTSLTNPLAVRVAQDGTINIVATDYTEQIRYKIWIVKPNGQLLTPNTHTEQYYYYDLAKDPYSDDYWVCGVTGDFDDVNGPQAVVEKFQINTDGSIGTNGINIPSEKLNPYDQQSPLVVNIFCGYNGVKYLVVRNQHIYKLTPSGKLTLLFPNVVFNGVYSVVSTKDSRTLYIAEGSKIKRYFNGKLQYLVGPQKPYDGGDGVGSSADVTAHHMVLSKDESTLYFTDYQHNTIRKLLLR
ncbi:hypothetical protein EOD41_09635 [Mucilaginibacter limnophilus]|uniref:6-bladed beta-propeller n=1 Tax=Mucilaginibacter limnophilus TaxID=1932778 RepID=A0A437MTA9_9SPHI|nr:hypothetical protein [Mucilaginibacter limnophilus]RVU00888.1 hypothetical protein EOD41_09635 [Mucilaginibacter limnophilus]